MVAGWLRKHEGQLVDVDVESVRHAAEASREYLFEAAGYQPDAFEDAFPHLQPAVLTT
jgi:5-methylthioadenosine/S-adenosylhomocysteine deaminase